MKGITGIIVAVGLGVAGAMANLFYLHSEAQKADTVSFVGVEKSVNSGDRLVEGNLVEVKIPLNRAGNLVDFAYKWEAMKSVVGSPVWRPLDCSNGAVLLLRSDIQTPHKELTLNKGERAVCVQAPRNFLTLHINPGDKVSFKFWNVISTGPTPARARPVQSPSPVVDPSPSPESAEEITQPAEPGDVIGPFVVMAIGNRLDSVEVMKAAKIAQVRDDVLVLRVSDNVLGEKQLYQKLEEHLHGAGSSSYNIIIDSKQ